MYSYSFEKLDVWKISRKLVVKIYQLTDDFPREEKYGLVSQMRRAAVSVTSNIAEGAGRKTAKDQASFYNNAYSSLVELLNQLMISSDLGWLSDEKLKEVRDQIERLSAMINSLRKSILK